jgi:uncharacterized membrane protein
METIMTATEEQKYHHDTGLERIVLFSDAVFAIAITLLVLEIKVPELTAKLAATELPSRVLEEWPKIRSYLISFLLLGFHWVAHHRKFRLIKRYDYNLVWLNLIFLLCISFLPFPTALLGQYGHQRFAVGFYAVCLAITGLSLTLLWMYASHGHRLVDKHLKPRVVTYNTLYSLIPAVVFLISIGLSFINPNLAATSWILIAFLGFFLRRFH